MSLPYVHKTMCSNKGTDHRGQCLNHMGRKLGFPKRIKPNELLEALKDILNSVEEEGCEGCVTVSIKDVNKAHALIGWEPLEDTSVEEEEEEDEDEDELDDEEWDEYEEDD